MPLNVEIKAQCQNQDKIRYILKERKADYRGLDHQIDTYFTVPNGRLKLRQGSIENNLIHYNRSDQSGPKVAEVTLYPCHKDEPKNVEALLETLTHALGIKVVVDKQREIYFIDNVKFHLDNVEQLGTFVEIEAIDTDGSMPLDRLQEQCSYYLQLFDIKDEDLITNSYSDLLT